MSLLRMPDHMHSMAGGEYVVTQDQVEYHSLDGHRYLVETRPQGGGYNSYTYNTTTYTTPKFVVPKADWQKEAPLSALDWLDREVENVCRIARKA